MYPRALRPPSGSFLLLGPRGSGKSTWLETRVDSGKTVDLLDEGLYQSLLADITGFARLLGPLDDGARITVDEIQRIPPLLNEVHRLMERRQFRFALSGSSARKLRQGGVNLLGGRAVRRLMYPFVPAELGPDFEIGRALRYGTLPVVWGATAPEDTLRAYVQMYLKEEIQAEAVVRNLPGFVRFLPVAALFHGQVLNVSALARDAGVARKTIAGYLEILEDTLVASVVPAFEARLRVRERKHPKLYWIDPGLVRAAKHVQGDVVPEETGPLLEGYVHMMLRLYGEDGARWESISYWSPAEARTVEVDFILQAGRELHAIEVKATRRIREEHFRGLRAIAGLAGLKKRILVYLGAEAQRTMDGIDVVPVASLVESLR